MDKDPVVRCGKRYCGLPSIGWRNLARSSRFWSEFPIEDRQIYFTHKGRCGLAILCRAWDLQPGDEVLMPAYNCGTEIDPFLCAGLQVKFYAVNRRAQAEIEDLFQRVTSKTKIVYVTHYFGWPQDLLEVSAYCRNNGLYLVEDCALSLFSRPAERPIGVLGDAAIYSFPKTLPVPDGGALIVAGSLSNVQEPSRSPAFGEIIKRMLPFGKRTLLKMSDRMRLYSLLPDSLSASRCRGETAATPAGLPEMPADYYFDRRIINQTISSVTRRILESIDPQRVVCRQRENYSRLHQVIEASRWFRPLYSDLPEGVCPLFLPVVVADPISVCRCLNTRGIAAMPWWGGFHRAFDWDGFEDAKILKRQLMALPIHYQLTDCQMDYMEEQIQQIDREAA